MTPHVIDVDKRSAAIQWPHSTDRKVVGPTKVVGNLISRGDQSSKGAAPLCPAVRWTYGQGIHVSRELTTAPVPLIFDESSSLSRTALGAGDREEHLARRAISISDREEACGNALHIALETARTIKQRSADMRTSIKSSFQ
jgi:hypothetical protein